MSTAPSGVSLGLDLTGFEARRSNWIVIWATNNLGLFDEVFPDLKMKLEPITVGTLGKNVVLGWRFVGSQGGVKAQVREIDQSKFALLAPWGAGVTPIPMTPPVNSDLYQWADQLILHPTDLDISDTSEDLVFPKACPQSLPSIKKDGSKDDMWEVEFALMPDRDRLTADPTDAVLGFIGQAAA